MINPPQVGTNTCYNLHTIKASKAKQSLVVSFHFTWTQRIASHFLFVRWWWWWWTTTTLPAPVDYKTTAPRRLRRRPANTATRSKSTMRFFAAWTIPATLRLCNLASTISSGLTSTVFPHGLSSLSLCSLRFHIHTCELRYFHFLSQPLC